MDNEWNRLVSFKDHLGIQYAVNLAKNGFYYVHNDHMIRCFSCKISITMDSPILSYHLPTCWFAAIRHDVPIDDWHQQQNTTTATNRYSVSSNALSTITSTIPPLIRNSCDELRIEKIAYPKYATYVVRMSSFKGWPSDLNQTPNQMALAGFFHPSVSDFARFFCCGDGLRNWEPNDDPLAEHARWYPECEYINKLKGPEYVRRAIQKHTRQTELRKMTCDELLKTEVAKTLTAMGFTELSVKNAI